MLDSLGWGELLVLVVLALFVFGPERLPTMAGEAGRALRRLRVYVKGVTADLGNELGPELGNVDLASLNPRTFVQRHLLSDEDDEPPPVVRTPRAGAPLGPGEPAPWDPDAT